MIFLKKAWKWIKVHYKLVLVILAFVLLFVFVLWIAGKNRKIKKLENTLRILRAKIDLERLSIKYATEVENLKELKEQETELRHKLDTIEKDLYEKLSEDMSANEIVKRMKEIGL